jgi:hypothetical protein
MAKRKPTPNVPAPAAPAAAKKPGRRTKYDPSMCETIIELGKRGRSKTQMAAHLNIARSTFENWLEAHDEFREAWELADTHSQALWESIGMAGLGKGHVFNDRCWSLQMRNRWPRDYKESRELELSGVGGAPIQIVMSPADANL